IARDPDVLCRKSAARSHVAGWLRKHHGRGVHQELVSGWPADAVFLVGIDDLPIAPGAAIGLAGGIALTRQRARGRIEYVAVWIVSAPRPRPELMLGDGVALAVDHHVQTGIEKMLMRRSAQPFRHHAAPGVRLARSDRRRLNDAGQLDLELDRAVLVKIPVEAVIVIADG